MTHEEIEAAELADRYVTGRLGAEECARFEEHFVDCPACQERLEAAERLRGALQRAGAENRAPQAGVRWQAWLVAACLLAAAGLSVTLALQVGTLRRELDASRKAANAARPVVAATFYLNTSRAAGGEPDPANRFTIPPGEQWVALSLEKSAEAVRGETSLTDGRGATVWNAAVAVAAGETPTVLLPANQLHPGDYSLTLTSGGVLLARYQFRILQ